MRDVDLEVFDPESDSQRLWDWMQRPHVARWWGDSREELQNLLRCSPYTAAVIVADGAQVGFLCWQRPSRNELEAAALTNLPEGLVDIDILIGEPEALGQGIGPTALGLLLARLRTDPLVSFAGVGASVSNERAIRAYEKAGFRLFREYEDLVWGPCRYMVADVRDAG